LAINPGSFGNRATIDIPTARTELLRYCKQPNCPSDRRRQITGIKLSLEARAVLWLTVKLLGDSAEDLQLETALQRILGQDDVAVRSREIKLVINRWNMYEPIRPAPLRLSGCHFVKEHSTSTSSGENKA
jgi:hypothetical protein